jgi:hypothetical protein
VALPHEAPLSQLSPAYLLDAGMMNIIDGHLRSGVLDRVRFGSSICGAIIIRLARVGVVWRFG